MLVSLKWLKEFVDVPDDLQSFCDRLDLTGTGVEGVVNVGDTLDGVLIGEVKTCEPHPDSDHMHVTTVDVAQDELLQIVCGAPNVRAGLKVAVATIGTVLPGDIKIKKSKLRGVVSAGMICSARELGLGNDHEGIMELPTDAPVGEPFAKWRGQGDTVLDLEITPNRPDQLSMRGFAREVGAMYHIPWEYKAPCKLPARTNDENVADILSVEIEEPERCPRYSAYIIRGVKIEESPDWIKERISAAGARPINNVVDISNYILFELGQPLHTFDLRAFPKGADGKHHVCVRPAKDGQEFTTLDGEKRKLTSDVTLIANGNEAVALAGVMGGLDSEVVDDTTDILLESATFSTAHTSRTSRNLGLVSEASLRYERGVDANTCAEFGEIAAALIAEICGGTVCKGVVDEYPLPAKPAEITLRPKRLRAHMGAEISDEEQFQILTDLGCEIQGNPKDEQVKVVAPTYRPDLTREADLYEEVLRIWGMDRVESTLPSGAHAGGRTLEQQKSDAISKTLRASGLNETLTYSFVPVDDLEKLNMPEEGRGKAVELLNPMNSEQSVLRRSIIPGLLRSLAYNMAHGVKNVQLFERGVVFGAANGKKNPKERTLVAGILSGKWHEKAWNNNPYELDFFDAKGVVENILRELCIPRVRFKEFDEHDATWLQPGRAAQVFSGGSMLGWVGEIHPKSSKAFDVEQAVAAFELDEHQLIACSTEQRPYVDVPTYPNVEADLALVVDEGLSAERVQQCIESAGKKGNLESVQLFDVYRDDVRVGKNKKSMAYRLSFRAADRTLTSEEVDKAYERIVKKVSGATGAEVRS